MSDVSEPALGCLVDVDEGREDEVLDAGGFAGIGDGLALAHLDVGGHGLPEVGDEEDGVGALNGWCGGFLGRHVGLRPLLVNVR